MALRFSDRAAPRQHLVLPIATETATIALMSAKIGKVNPKKLCAGLQKIDAEPTAGVTSTTKKLSALRAMLLGRAALQKIAWSPAATCGTCFSSDTNLLHRSMPQRQRRSTLSTAAKHAGKARLAVTPASRRAKHATSGAAALAMAKDLR